jgi:Ran GTPase-activating protein (RanGAP) involved in mRNA processing and transport
MAVFKPVFPAEMLKVFISPKDVMFGMSRMFQEAGLGTRRNIRVVRIRDEALKIIGVESPTFTEVVFPETA